MSSAVRLFNDNPGNFLQRTATLPSYIGSYTWGMWIRPNQTAFDTTSWVLSLVNSSTNAVGDAIQLGGDNKVHLYARPTAGSATGTTVLSVSTGYFITYQRDVPNSLHRVFLGLTPSTVAEEVTIAAPDRTGADPADQIRIGCAGFHNESGGDTFDGRVDYSWLYESALTLAQIKTEHAAAARVLAGAWEDWPLQGASDLTGHLNSRSWSAAGTGALTTEAGPDLTLSQNISGAITPSGVLATAFAGSWYSRATISGWRRRGFVTSRL